MIIKVSSYCTEHIHISALEQPCAAYYPLVMGLVNGCRDVKVVSGVSLRLKITPGWMEPDSHQSYSTEQATHTLVQTHTHTYTHSLISACDWKPKPLKKAQGRQQDSLKQVLCAGNLPSELLSEDSCPSERPSFKFYIPNRTTGV